MSDATETVVRKIFDNTFGNYLLHGIDEIEIPVHVPWWPETVAWKILLALVSVGITKYAWRRLRKWQANKYRRIAIEKLREIELEYFSKNRPQSLQELPVILKATALQAYPRENIARSSNKEWLALLSRTAPNCNFDSSLGELLLCIAYQPSQYWQTDDKQVRQLFDLSRDWIRTHQPMIRSADSRRSLFEVEAQLGGPHV